MQLKKVFNISFLYFFKAEIFIRRTTNPSRICIRIYSQCSSLGDVICKAFGRQQAFAPIYDIKRFLLEQHVWIHSTPFLNTSEKVVGTLNHSEKGGSVDDAYSGNGKVKRKKLKGKRAVVRWLKFFRWKKKKEYERMTAEEKILYKLRKVSS